MEVSTECLYRNQFQCLLTLSMPNVSYIRQGGKNSKQILLDSGPYTIYKLYFNMPGQRQTQMSFMANYLFYGPPLVVESKFQLVGGERCRIMGALFVYWV